MSTRENIRLIARTPFANKIICISDHEIKDI